MVKFNDDLTVTIGQARYEELCDAEQFLNALEAAGVDNWEGYELAQEMMDEEE